MKENETLRPVPAVRLIVPDASGRVLILRRAPGSAAAGQWCLPGGKVDYGDSVGLAAAKELREETGLRIGKYRFLFYQDSLPPAPGAMHCINLCLECSADGEVVLNEESTAAAWIGPADLDRYPLAFRGGDALVRYWRGE
jgi:8-oxo-dGTP diphosphatase